MKKLLRALKGSGEPLLWLGFLAAVISSLEGSGSDNAPTVAGLFALAAIGVRATRPERSSNSVAIDGDQ